MPLKMSHGKWRPLCIDLNGLNNGNKRNIKLYPTLKNPIVEPPSTVPYFISVCFAKSSADSMGLCIRSTVRNAAKLAVYEEMMIRVKNHHTLPTMRPDNDLNHDDVIKWKPFPRHWPLMRGIHRSPVNSPHKGQWRGALIFSFICAWINGWVNNRVAGNLRRHRGHYDVIVLYRESWVFWYYSSNYPALVRAIQIYSGVFLSGQTTGIYTGFKDKIVLYWMPHV